MKAFWSQPTRWPALGLAALLTAGGLAAQSASTYRHQAAWSPVPASPGPEWEMAGVAANGMHTRLFAVRRIDPPVLELDPASGKVLRQWGEGLLVWPHSLYMDRDGFIWVADATVSSPAQANRDLKLNNPMESAVRAGRGYQVLKFTPDGTLVMSLGTRGVAGEAPGQFNAPTGVAVAPNGDIFVSDGHGNTNSRVLKFRKDGTFVLTWGKRGKEPGEFNEPHAIAMDSKGRVIVADRNNGRLQVFDQNGRFLAQYTGFGTRPSGIAIAPDDTMFVTSHDTRTHASTITVGRAADGTVIEVLNDVIASVDGIAVDGRGSLYATSNVSRSLAKYTRR